MAYTLSVRVNVVSVIDAAKEFDQLGLHGAHYQVEYETMLSSDLNEPV